MALLLRTVSSTCGGAVAAAAISRAKSGGSFFQDQEMRKRSGDAPARCQAAAVAVRQSVGVLERPPPVVAEPEARPATIDQRAEPLARSFIAESVGGDLVECSARGSRPLYTNVLAEFQRSFMTGTTTEIVPKTVDIAKVTNAFHAALADTPGDARLVSEFAMFTWKALGDADVAEELYNKAIALAPEDPIIQASHAVFLWQCDD